MNKDLEHNNLISKWLNGELSKEEMQKLEAEGELDDLKHVLEDIGGWKLPAFDVQKGFIDIKKRKVALLENPVKKNQIRPFLASAAAIALIVITYFTLNTLVRSGEVKFATAIGETIVHELPDGSNVHLDASSEIAYNASSWDKERNISLKGQAFFKVKKGERFKVKVSHGFVQVLGTQFNVKDDKKTLEVKCYKGKVEVKTQKGNAILTKGQGIKLNEDKLFRFEVDSISSPDWIEGYTMYSNTQLSQVIEDLKKYYEVNIKLPRKYSKLKFTGKVPHSDLKLALKTILVPMEIPYTISDDGKRVIFK